VLEFVRAARASPGVYRIALIGSLATEKKVPKDADVLVIIDAAMDLARLARLGRRLKGPAQRINLGRDIFLADEASRYLGRIYPRRADQSASLNDWRKWRAAEASPASFLKTAMIW
jgi:predicted nucleotidyltransferase